MRRYVPGFELLRGRWRRLRRRHSRCCSAKDVRLRFNSVFLLNFVFLSREKLLIYDHFFCVDSLRDRRQLQRPERMAASAELTAPAILALANESGCEAADMKKMWY